MTWGLVAVAGATLVGGAMASDAAGDAASVQAASADRAADLQYQQFKESTALQEPWRKAGEQALNKLIPLTDYKKFDMSTFEADPGYAFRLSEGQKALDRQAAARGGLISGSALKATARYGQEMGSQEYTNAFNRYQTERAAQLQPLQSLAGVGQTTAQQIGQAGQNYANAAGEAYMGAANARASGYVGGANALSSSIGNIGNMYMQNTYMNQRYPTVGNIPSSSIGYGAGYAGEGPIGYAP